jgi:hypothetical protein
MGIEDVETFQRFLVGYQIHVISREHFNGIVYHGLTADKKIYLYYHDWIIIFTSLAIDVSTGMISHSFVHGLSAVLTFVIGGAR